MIWVCIFVALAGFFVLLLLSTDEKIPKEATGEGWLAPEAGGCRDVLPIGDIASRIFSREDREFVLRLGSPGLRSMYQQERREVALLWVARISGAVGNIMHEHRLASRYTRNLDAGTEAKLVLQHARFRLVCGLLMLLIRIFGPHALGDLAAHVGELYQRISKVVGTPEIALDQVRNTH
jgi:hypothetical protein